MQPTVWCVIIVVIMKELMVNIETDVNMWLSIDGNMRQRWLCSFTVCGGSRIALYCHRVEQVLLLAVAVLIFIGHALCCCKGTSPWTS
jgi:hypothetical protein